MYDYLRILAFDVSFYWQLTLLLYSYGNIFHCTNMVHAHMIRYVFKGQQRGAPQLADCIFSPARWIYGIISFLSNKNSWCFSHSFSQLRLANYLKRAYSPLRYLCEDAWLWQWRLLLGCCCWYLVCVASARLQTKPTLTSWRRWKSWETWW